MSDLSRRLFGWLQEAKRRRLVVPVVAYVAVTVTIIELSDAIFEALLLPEWSSRLVTVLLILGFPVVVILAWVFDLTPEGVRRTDGAEAEEAGASSPPTARTGGPPSRHAPSAPRVRRVSTVRAGASPPPGAGGTVAVADPPDADQGEGGPPDPDRVKRAALGHVRHELKTPINAILGYSEMLLEDLEEEGGDPGIRPDLQKVRKAGRRLLDLVDETLSPVRLSEEGGELDLEAYGAQLEADLRTPVTSVIGYAELLGETSRESGREYLVPDLERIETAARRLLELSSEIVRVATDHMSGSQGPSAIERASLLTEGVLAKTRNRAGTAAEEGQGSLLVVDDNAMNRDLLSRQLARAGYVVQTAESGRSALDLMAGRDFDLVLLDVIMPDMDGLDVLRAVKSDPQLAPTPVVMLSSLDDVESAIRCIELGAEDFLHKPFHPTLLQTRIGAVLEVREMRSRQAAHEVRLEESRSFSRRLLRSSFPEAIAERIRSGESTIVESYPDATVVWCDVEGSARTHARDQGQVAGRIQQILEAVEQAARAQGVDTLVPLGDGLALAVGVPLPVEEGPDQAAATALALRDALAGDPTFDAPVRLGVDAGEVTGGVLGRERLAYRLWGEPLDLARTLGCAASSGEVVVSPGAYRLLKERWAFASHGVREIPGRGQVKTYVLEGPA